MVLTNILTIGEISHFYECLKSSEKNNIAKQFNLNLHVLSLYLKNLTLARNLYAHNERFYDYRFYSGLPVKTISNFSILGILSNSSGFSFMVPKMFSQLQFYNQFLSKRDIRDFIPSIDKEFSKLSKELHFIALNRSKRIMGLVLIGRKYLDYNL